MAGSGKLALTNPGTVTALVENVNTPDEDTLKSVTGFPLKLNTGKFISLGFLTIYVILFRIVVSNGS